MRRTLIVTTALAAMLLPAAPALAHHGHFVHVRATNTCQFVAHGQTSIDDAGHGGHHRFHDNVHTGTPGTDGRGNGIDKAANLANYEGCTVRGAR